MAKRVRGGVKYSTKPYGQEFTTLYQSGNIKFVKNNDGSASAPMFTKTKGRIYVTVNAKNELKAITYYDKNLNRYKQIDLNPAHPVNGVKTAPHLHKGLIHNENGDYFLSQKEWNMVDRVTKTWYNFINK